MMREDETGNLAQLKTLRKEVFDPRTTEYNGRIVKTIGDGMLVEFASAVADTLHEVVDGADGLGDGGREGQVISGGGLHGHGTRRQLLEKENKGLMRMARKNSRR